MGLGGEGGEEGLAVDSGVLVDCDEVVVVVDMVGTCKNANLKG